MHKFNVWNNGQTWEIPIRNQEKTSNNTNEFKISFVNNDNSYYIKMPVTNAIKILENSFYGYIIKNMIPFINQQIYCHPLIYTWRELIDINPNIRLHSRVVLLIYIVCVNCCFLLCEIIFLCLHCTVLSYSTTLQT